MSDGIRHLFADIKSALEDMHGIAVEGQCNDNAPDMQRMLISQLRLNVTAMARKMGEIKIQLGDTYE